LYKEEQKHNEIANIGIKIKANKKLAKKLAKGAGNTE
jgi:hypothetical protein